ncbi:ATP-dependent zinc metalloprotease FtsH [Bienertia sinuspersici]
MQLLVGFSVKKAKKIGKKEGTQIIKEKYYFCSTQAERNTGKKKEEQEVMAGESTSTKVKKRKKKKSHGSKDWIVHHVMQHNHPLTREPLNCLHRSER